MSTRADFRHLERLRVRWAEVDLQKIVFNGHYLMYLDTAVAGYWRAMALPYQATMDPLGGDLYVRKATLEYNASARYDELIDVGIKTARIGNSSMVLAGGVFRGDELLVGGELVYVFANPATQTSLPVPPDLRAVLTAFEAGRPMIDVRISSWDLLGRDAAALRTEVFVAEQKIPAELVWDAADARALHAVAYNRLGLALATGCLLEHTPGVSKIGRMAVMAPLRGSRIGWAVLDALVRAARERGDQQVLLHAQASAEPFFSRSGFVAQGPALEEAGIPRQAMVKAL